MTEMGFGYYTGDQGQEPADDLVLQQQQAQAQAAQGSEPQGNGLRQYLKSLEEKTKAQDKLLQQLLAESQRNQVANTLEAKGYDRAAASLYTGDPAKVDEWLNTAGSLLAKRPDPAGQGAGAGADAAQTTVTSDGQAQLQAFQNAGQNAAPPLGKDMEQAAEIAKLNSAEELTAYLAANGNEQAQYWNG